MPHVTKKFLTRPQTPSGDFVVRPTPHFCSFIARYSLFFAMYSKSYDSSLCDPDMLANLIDSKDKSEWNNIWDNLSLQIRPIFPSPSNNSFFPASFDSGSAFDHLGSQFDQFGELNDELSAEIFPISPPINDESLLDDSLMFELESSSLEDVSPMPMQAVKETTPSISQTDSKKTNLDVPKMPKDAFVKVETANCIYFECAYDHCRKSCLCLTQNSPDAEPMLNHIG